MCRRPERAYFRSFSYRHHVERLQMAADLLNGATHGYFQ